MVCYTTQGHVLRISGWVSSGPRGSCKASLLEKRTRNAFGHLEVSCLQEGLGDWPLATWEERIQNYETEATGEALCSPGE